MPAAAAAVLGKATLTHGTPTDEIGCMPPSTVRQLAGTVMTILPSSAFVIALRPMPMPQPAHARLPGRTYSSAGMSMMLVMTTLGPLGRWFEQGRGGVDEDGADRRGDWHREDRA